MSNADNPDDVKLRREEAIAEIREKLAESTHANIDGLLAILEQTTDLSVLKFAFCPKCREMVKVDYPDFKGMAQLWKVALEYVLGKPSQHVEVKHTIVTRIEDLAALPTEELERIAGVIEHAPAGVPALPSGS